MRRGRWLLFFGLLVGSVLLSVLGTLYLRSPFLALFLVLPFLPFVFGHREGPASAKVQVCPACGFRSSDPLDSFCPRDGSRLGPEKRT